MAKLSINETAQGYTDVFRFDFNDLKTAGFLSTLGAANQVKIGTHEAGGVIDTVAVFVVTPAAGASDIVLDVGTTGADPDDFIDALDLDALTKATFNTGDGFTVGADVNTGNGVILNSATALPIYAEVGGTVANLTAGEWIIAINQKRIPLGK